MYPKGPLRGLSGHGMAFDRPAQRKLGATSIFGTEEYIVLHRIYTEKARLKLTLIININNNVAE